MELEKFIELLKKLDQLEKHEKGEQNKPLNSNELQEAYHHKSLQKFHEIEYNLKKIHEEVIELNDFRIDNHNLLKNFQVQLSNIDVSIQATNAKFDVLMELLEYTEAYKESRKAKELQDKAAELVDEAQKHKQSIENMPLSDPKFKLAYNSKFVLGRHGIKTIKQLITMNERELLRLENIGVVRVRKIQEALDALDLKLREL